MTCIKTGLDLTEVLRKPSMVDPVFFLPDAEQQAPQETISSCLFAADSTRVSLVSMALSPPRTEAEDLIIALFSYVSVAASKERERERLLLATLRRWEWCIVLWECQSRGLDAVYRSTIEQVTSLIPQLVKNLPAMQQTLVWFLGQEDPLEKG